MYTIKPVFSSLPSQARQRKLWICYIYSFVCFFFFLNQTIHVFYSDQLKYDTLYPVSPSFLFSLPRSPQPPKCADDADCLRLVSGFCDRDLNHILLDRLDQINISQHIGKIILSQRENAWNEELSDVHCTHQGEFKEERNWQ